MRTVTAWVPKHPDTAVSSTVEDDEAVELFNLLDARGFAVSLSVGQP